MGEKRGKQEHRLRLLLRINEMMQMTRWPSDLPTVDGQHIWSPLGHHDGAPPHPLCYAIQRRPCLHAGLLAGRGTAPGAVRCWLNSS